MTLGDLRRAAGLSQAQLAEKAGIKLGTLKKLESGERSIGKSQVDTVLPLAKVLGVTIEQLVDEDQLIDKIIEENIVAFKELAK